MRNECVNVMAPCLNDLNEMYEIWNTTKAISHHLTELTSFGCKVVSALVILLVREMLLVLSAGKMQPIKPWLGVMSGQL